MYTHTYIHTHTQARTHTLTHQNASRWAAQRQAVARFVTACSVGVQGTAWVVTCAHSLILCRPLTGTRTGSWALGRHVPRVRQRRVPQDADAAFPAVRQVQGRGLLQQGVSGVPPPAHTCSALRPSPRLRTLTRSSVPAPPRSLSPDRGVEGRAQARVRAGAGRGEGRADPAGRAGEQAPCNAHAGGADQGAEAPGDSDERAASGGRLAGHRGAGARGAGACKNGGSQPGGWNP